MRIDQSKLEEVLRNLGVVFVSSGVIGFFFEFSIIGSMLTIIFGVLLIIFGIKESNNGNK